MSNASSRPRSLQVLGWLFIVVGALSVVNFVSALAEGTVALNPRLLLPLVGYGLLRGAHDFWRVAALVVAWLFAAAALVLPPLVYFGAVEAGAMYPSWSALAPSPAAAFFAAGATVVIFLIAVWSIRLLGKAEVKRQFAPRDTSARAERRTS